MGLVNEGSKCLPKKATLIRHVNEAAR
jgi:hypothetical protein